MFFNNKRKDYSVSGNKTQIGSTPFVIDDTDNIDLSFVNNILTANLVPTGIVSGTYGSTTQIPVITVDQFGRITGITTTNSTKLQTNGVDNVKQDKLNLIAGDGITLIPDTNGGVTIESDLATSWNVLIDGGFYLTPNQYTLIDAGSYI